MSKSIKILTLFMFILVVLVKTSYSEVLTDRPGDLLTNIANNIVKRVEEIDKVNKDKSNEINEKLEKIQNSNKALKQSKEKSEELKLKADRNNLKEEVFALKEEKLINVNNHVGQLLGDLFDFGYGFESYGTKSPEQNREYIEMVDGFLQKTAELIRDLGLEDGGENLSDDSLINVENIARGDQDFGDYLIKATKKVDKMKKVMALWVQRLESKKKKIKHLKKKNKIEGDGIVFVTTMSTVIGSINKLNEILDDKELDDLDSEPDFDVDFDIPSSKSVSYRNSLKRYLKGNALSGN